MWKAFLDPLPRGYALEEQEWQRRHRLLLILLTAHIPALAVVGGLLGRDFSALLAAITVPAACAALGLLLRHRRRAAAVTVTLGLVYCSAALVGLTGGAIEAHFHFFVIIGFIALYQDWIPFLFMILFTTTSHVAGSYWKQGLIFNHEAGQANPWLWSLIHGVAVLAACVGIILLWHVTDDVQEKIVTARRVADAEVGKRRFTHDLLVNLARRNQSMLYRQLEIINHLEESERDPDTLAELFALDHLATRVRRNAESLLVLSGEQPQRVWSRPVPLRDVLRAAIAETEDLDRVVFVADEELAVAGHTITDLTHLIAELTENAVRFSPPDSTVSIRANPNPRVQGGYAITVEDWGVGMPADQLAAANELLARPPEVDLSVAHRLGFHVVARLAARHYIAVSLSATPSSGITATILLPPTLFTGPSYDITEPVPQQRPVLDAPAGSLVGSAAAGPMASSGGPAAVGSMPGGPAPAGPVTGAVDLPEPEAQPRPGPRRWEPPAPATPTPLGPAPTMPAAMAAAPTAPSNEPAPIGFPVMRLSSCPTPALQSGVVFAAAGSGSNGHPIGAPIDRLRANGVPAAETAPAARTAASAPEPVAERQPVAAPEERVAERQPVAAPEERWPGWWAAGVEGTLPEPGSYGSAGYGSAADGPGHPEPARPQPARVDPARVDAAQVESAQVESAQVESARPKSTRPGPTHPDPVRPDPVRPGSRPGSADREPFGQDREELVPSPRPRTAATAQRPPHSGRRSVDTDAPQPVEVPIDPVSGLRRRIPQTHLAPGLRQSRNAPEPPDRRRPDHGWEAADALSRYQASRQAARTVVEDAGRWGS